jgi:hypothetical protein
LGIAALTPTYGRSVTDSLVGWGERSDAQQRGAIPQFPHLTTSIHSNEKTMAASLPWRVFRQKFAVKTIA